MRRTWGRTPDEIKSVIAFQKILVSVPDYQFIVGAKFSINFSNGWVDFDCGNIVTPKEGVAAYARI